MDKLNMHTPNLADENYCKLAALFPNAVTETIDEVTGEVVRAIDKDVLMQEISAKVVEGREERYQFTWPDKKKAVLVANAPISATLRPVREDSVSKDGTPGGWDSENLYIEGDNLDVLKLLRETYLGKVKLIYIDPPYNTGNDFVYEDDFAETTASYIGRSGQYDDQGNQLVPNLDTNGRFHTDWLNMIYPRLRLAKDLLSDNGVIFISMDEHELDNLMKICNEIFGEQNFVTNVIWQKRYTRSNNTDNFTTTVENILVYQKSPAFQVNLLKRDQEANDRFTNPDNDPRGPWKATPFLNQVPPEKRPNLCYPITNPYTGTVANPTTKAWRYERKKYEELLRDNRLYWGVNQDRLVPDIKTFLSEVRQGMTPINFWSHEFAGHTDNANAELKSLFDRKVFDTPKPSSLIKRILEHGSSEDCIVMDFFSGSAPTAHAVMRLNAEDGGTRKYILVQIPENCDTKSEAYNAGYHTICEVGKERIRRAGRKVKEEAGLIATNLDIGFRVLRLDSSNMQEVYYNPANMVQSLLDLTTDNIKPDRTPEELLFQVMLELGIMPSSAIAEILIAGKRVFDVADGFLLACFDTGVTTETVTAIAKKQPYYAVFRDSSMADDSVATNFDQIFETYSPSTVRKVL